MIAVTWLFPISLPLILLATDPQLTITGLQASKHWCFVAMSSMEIRNRICTTLILLVILGTIAFLIFGHLAIILSFQKWNRQKGRQRSHDMEWKLIKKSTAISLVFTLTWILFIAKAIYEVSSSREVSPEYDIVLEIAVLIGPINNIFVLYGYDAKFSKTIRETLKLHSFVAIFSKFQKMNDAPIEFYSNPMMNNSTSSTKELKAGNANDQRLQPTPKRSGPSLNLFFNNSLATDIIQESKVTNPHKTTF